MKRTRAKASDIYRRQNRLLHRAFEGQGFSYRENKEVWLKLMTDIAGRPVGGLSEMTLGERHRLIAHFQGRGLRLFAPAVPKALRDWKKGDAEAGCEFRQDDDPRLRMVYAMWAEMGYPEKTLRGLCWRRFRRDDPRWLDEGQLSRLLNIVKQKARSKGYGHYWRRGPGMSP